MRLVAVVLGAVCVSVATIAAQSAPAFDVASVKPNKSGSPTSSGRSTKGSVDFRNMQLRFLISNAFGVRPTRVIGGPGWIDTERYDIAARAPENTTDEQLSLMLRRLLVERFRLAAKMESREQPAYALVLAREDGRLGPNLLMSVDCDKRAQFPPAPPRPGATQLAAMPCGSRRWNDGRETVIQAGAQPIARLARFLDGMNNREVLERTNLSGTFTFELRFAPPTLSDASTDAGLPSLFAALDEQLGLKLESTRAPVDVVVIDSVERPTPD